MLSRWGRNLYQRMKDLDEILVLDMIFDLKWFLSKLPYVN